MRRLLLSFSIITSGLIVFGCGGGGRALIVRSEPADADICIKGKSKSEYFSNQKSCVGTTPFEAEKVDVQSPDGDKHTVKFEDVEGDKEKFYVIVSRPGYASQSLDVPGWEHTVTLKPEGHGNTTQINLPAGVSASAAAAPQAFGSVRITSEPVGALVYINETLRGNTPFTHEAAVGVFRLKLELEGYRTLEKPLSIEADKTLDVNFKLMEIQKAVVAPAKATTTAVQPAVVAQPTTAPAPATPAAVPAQPAAPTQKTE